MITYFDGESYEHVRVCTLVQWCAFQMIIFLLTFFDPAKSTKAFHRLSVGSDKNKISSGSWGSLKSYLINEKKKQQKSHLAYIQEVPREN